LEQRNGFVGCVQRRVRGRIGHLGKVEDSCSRHRSNRPSRLPDSTGVHYGSTTVVMRQEWTENAP
jgi:hypothetical protein